MSKREKKLFSAFFEHYYNVKESSASTHICKFPSRYSLAYSSGSSMASVFNAQSDPVWFSNSFLLPSSQCKHIVCTGIKHQCCFVRDYILKYCSHRILSPYRSINYLLQKSEAFQSVHHVTLFCVILFYMLVYTKNYNKKIMDNFQFVDV